MILYLRHHIDRMLRGHICRDVSEKLNLSVLWRITTLLSYPKFRRFVFCFCSHSSTNVTRNMVKDFPTQAGDYDNINNRYIDNNSYGYYPGDENVEGIRQRILVFIVVLIFSFCNQFLRSCRERSRCCRPCHRISYLRHIKCRCI